VSSSRKNEEGRFARTKAQRGGKKNRGRSGVRKANASLTRQRRKKESEAPDELRETGMRGKLESGE